MLRRRPHRVLVRSLGLAAALALPGACSSVESAAPGAPPSIVVITIDTLRADHLGCYGYPRDTSPNIDRFAAEGLLFENSFSTIATTLPSHVSLWTSRHPLETGVMFNQAKFEPPSEPARKIFLAQWLRDRGYDTAAFVSAKPLRGNSGIQSGFALYDDPKGRERPGDETTDLVIEWLRDRPRDADAFLLWVHYFDPHTPYEAPDGFRRFDGDGKLASFLGARAFEDPEDPKVQKLHDEYDAEVSFVDAQVGRLLRGLRRHQDWEALTIVLTADHGEGLLEHDWATHGRINNEQLRVPLLMKLPRRLGIEPGRRAQLASSVDVVPTLAAALELPVPAEHAGKLRGVDLLTGLRDRVFAQKRFHMTRDVDEGHVFSIVTDEWKYLHRSKEADTLFDLRRDPFERVDVREQHPGIAAEMQQELLAWIDEQTRSQGLLSVRADLDPELAEHLRALGYVE